MVTISTPKVREAMNEVHFHPAISIIMPFEPKMKSKKQLTHSLKLATDKMELELSENYSDEIEMLMMQKIEAIISSLNYSTHKKSVAIYLNPVFEKVLYLDISVEEKVTVDDTFKIRDLIDCKIEEHKYLVMLLGCKESEMYIGDSESFVKIMAESRDAANTYIDDVPEQWNHFYDIAQRKKIVTDIYINHIDDILGLILKSCQSPLFILGTEKIIGHFKNVTKHTGAVIEYIYGSYEETTIEQLKEVLKPYTYNKKKLYQYFDLFH